MAAEGAAAVDLDVDEMIDVMEAAVAADVTGMSKLFRYFYI